MGKRHVETGDGSRIAKREREQDESAHGQGSCRDLAGGNARQGHHDHQRNAARGQSQPGCSGVVAQQLLHELRLKDSVSVQHPAHQHHQETADGEVFEAEQPEIDDGILGAQLPDDEAGHPAHEQEREEFDEAGCKPVVLLALVEHDLHAAHGDGKETQPQVVHLGKTAAIRLDPRRIIHYPGDQNKGQ